MAASGRPRARSALQEELLGLLRPPDRRRSRLPSERALPGLVEVARTHAGRPSAQVLAALEDVVRAVGGEPDRAALQEFAEQVSQGHDPFS